MAYSKPLTLSDLDIQADKACDIYCEPCEIDKKSISAQGFCVQCKEYMCTTCCHYHKKFGLTKNHVIKDETEMPRDTSNITKKQVLVDLCIKSGHEDKLIEYLCPKCDQLACQVCIITNHQKCGDTVYLGNLGTDLHPVSADFEARTTKLSKKVTQIGHVLKVNLESIGNFRNDALEALKQQREKINAHFDKLEQTIKDDIEDIQKDDEIKTNNLSQRHSGVTSRLSALNGELDKRSGQRQKLQRFIHMMNCRQELGDIENMAEDISKENTINEYAFIQSDQIMENICTTDIGRVVISDSQRMVSTLSISSQPHGATKVRPTDDQVGGAILRQEKPDSDGAMIFSLSEAGKVRVSSEQADRVASLDTVTPLEGSNAESKVGAAAANAPDSTSNEGSHSKSLVTPEPVSVTAQMSDNVNCTKASAKTDQASEQQPNKSDDFAPEFANQLVAASVNAAGQAYITAKAVFKTWQERQEARERKHQTRHVHQAKATGESKSQPKGWKLTSTPCKPPEDAEYKWNPPKVEFRSPKSEWKAPKTNFKPPQPKPEEEKQCAIPKKWTTSKEEDKWTPPKESGPMGRLFEMGFYDRDLNRNLLNTYNNNIDMVIQELLSMENKNCAAKAGVT